jgi:leucyl/phenylalanyl-tRNA--protein transferase
MFFGESMFSREVNASKTGLIFLHQQLAATGFRLIDCQVYNDHLGSMGARNIDRDEFLEILNVELEYPTIRGNWNELMMNGK